MDVPTSKTFHDIQIYKVQKENDNLVNSKGILTQILYIDSLKEKEKKEYEKKMMHIVVVEKEK